MKYPTDLALFKNYKSLKVAHFAKNKNGFTLLEVIISISLLAFISIYTAQSIQQGIKSKAKIQKRIDKDSQLRDALKVMANDIRQAFHYRNIHVEVHNLAQDERAKSQQQKQPAQSPQQNQTNSPKQTQKQQSLKPLKKYKKRTATHLTHFIGKGDELHLTTTSYTRSQPDIQASNQAEIGYSLKTCRNRANPKQQSECLWRRATPYIDDNIEEGGNELVLLENITKFQLRYLGENSEDWLDTWLSDERGDATTIQKISRGC